MALIHVYKGTVTAAGTNGTLVSEDGAGTSRIATALLNAATNEEGSAITLAIRCDSGYKTSGNVTITPTGTTAAKWALSADNSTWGSYGAALTIGTEIVATNTLFYAKAKATSDENPVNDTSVGLAVVADIIAA